MNVTGGTKQTNVAQIDLFPDAVQTKTKDGEATSSPLTLTPPNEGKLQHIQPMSAISTSSMYNATETTDFNEVTTATDETTKDAPTEKCAECGLMKAGKVDENDGAFYCYSCWEQYE